MDCSACLSCGMVVLLIIAGCRLFHSLMVLGKKDDLLGCTNGHFCHHPSPLGHVLPELSTEGHQQTVVSSIGC